MYTLDDIRVAALGAYEKEGVPPNAVTPQMMYEAVCGIIYGLFVHEQRQHVLTAECPECPECNAMRFPSDARDECAVCCSKR